MNSVFYALVNEFFRSRYITGKIFSHALTSLRHGLSVFTKLNVFGKHLQIALEIEGSNVSTFPHCNISSSFSRKCTLYLHLKLHSAALTQRLQDQFY